MKSRLIIPTLVASMFIGCNRHGEDNLPTASDKVPNTPEVEVEKPTPNTISVIPRERLPKEYAPGFNQPFSPVLEERPPLEIIPGKEVPGFKRWDLEPPLVNAPRIRLRPNGFEIDAEPKAKGLDFDLPDDRQGRFVINLNDLNKPEAPQFQQLSRARKLIFQDQQGRIFQLPVYEYEGDKVINHSPFKNINRRIPSKADSLFLDDSFFTPPSFKQSSALTGEVINRTLHIDRFTGLVTSNGRVDSVRDFLIERFKEEDLHQAISLFPGGTDGNYNKSEARALVWYFVAGPEKIIHEGRLLKLEAMISLTAAQAIHSKLRESTKNMLETIQEIKTIIEGIKEKERLRDLKWVVDIPNFSLNNSAV